MLVPQTCSEQDGNKTPEYSPTAKDRILRQTVWNIHQRQMMYIETNWNIHQQQRLVYSDTLFGLSADSKVSYIETQTLWNIRRQQSIVYWDEGSLEYPSTAKYPIMRYKLLEYLLAAEYRILRQTIGISTDSKVSYIETKALRNIHLWQSIL
jgi:hypothetical protein